MKTEVSLQELTELQNAVKALFEENRELKKKLGDLNEFALRQEYEQKALRAAMNLANYYLSAIFKKLGFNVNNTAFYEPIQFEGRNTEYYLRDEWYKNSEKLEIDIHVSLTNQWRMLLLKIGYKEPVKIEKEKKSILDQ